MISGITHILPRSEALALLIASLSVVIAGHCSAEGKITTSPCPYSCASLGLDKSVCRDWRQNSLCFVQDLRPQTPSRLKLCSRGSGSTVFLRTRCRRSEEELSTDLLRGESGPAGPAGAPGVYGAPGADGSLRIYGDGSAGANVISTTTTFSDINLQYTDFTIASGATLTVPSGTVIRCTGTFTNNGSILVLPALRGHPRFAEDGARIEGLSSGGAEAPGGVGGSSLPEVVARSLLRLGLSGGGTGYLEKGESGSTGGGNFTVLCRQAAINNGSIVANGSDAATLARGGGGGGFIILASQNLTSNTGTVSATGGQGASLSATDTGGRGQGPGGGGGGGIVHLIAPNASNSGTIDVSGGAGGAAGGAGAIAGFVYLGGGGGGGSGGEGGDGGAVNPGGIGNDSTGPGAAGANGLTLVTTADPTTIF